MIVLILIILGLCFGSFVNAWVWRVHELSKPKSKRAAKDKDLSVTKGRSMCPDCKHTLAAKDLIPVASWLSLGGKCRYCHKRISWQYPVVELIVAGLFVLSYYLWPIVTMPEQPLQIAVFVVFLIATVVGVALAVYDLKWMLLPNRLVAIFAGFGALFAIINVIASGNTIMALGGTIYSILVAGGIFWVLFQVSGGKWIGGGDVKLGLVLGLFLLSPAMACLMLFSASLLGTLYALMLYITRKYKRGVHIPFGPFLLMATYFVVLFGERVMEYYTNFLISY